MSVFLRLSRERLRNRTVFLKLNNPAEKSELFRQSLCAPMTVFHFLRLNQDYSLLTRPTGRAQLATGLVLNIFLEVKCVLNVEELGFVRRHSTFFWENVQESIQAPT